MYVGGETIFTFSMKTRGRATNHNYFYPPCKNNKLRCNTSHPFSILIICIHSTRVWKDLIACKNTCSTLAAIYNADSVPDWKFNLELANRVIVEEDNQQVSSEATSKVYVLRMNLYLGL